MAASEDDDAYTMVHPGSVSGSKRDRRLTIPDVPSHYQDFHLDPMAREDPPQWPALLVCSQHAWASSPSLERQDSNLDYEGQNLAGCRITPCSIKSHLPELNGSPARYKGAALPDELRWHKKSCVR
jgi:hypothetical protein